MNFVYFFLCVFSIYMRVFIKSIMLGKESNFVKKQEYFFHIERCFNLSYNDINLMDFIIVINSENY
jgi:hypothetical protein